MKESTKKATPRAEPEVEEKPKKAAPKKETPAIEEKPKVKKAPAAKK